MFALALALTLAPSVAPAMAPRSIHIWIGGDVHLGAARSDPLASLAHLLAGAPLVVNLEGPVAEGRSGTGADGRLRLLNAPRALAALRRGGVRVAGIANNHALDAGPEGPDATAAALRRARVRPTGLRAGPVILDLGEWGVAITAHDLSPGVPAGLRDELRAARGRASSLVATFHVTGPPLYLPSAELKEAALIALEEGAAVVAAHGTHVLGPVERRGPAVIAWGLGNLAFACDCTEERDGLLLGVTLGAGGVGRAEVLPIEAGLRGGPARVAPDDGALPRLLEALGSAPLRREGGRILF